MEFNHAARALFKTTGKDGTLWLFFVSNHNWTITRDGTQMARGLSDRASLADGLRKFLSLAAIVPEPREKRQSEHV
jgi:hypothetical protein